MSNGAVTRRVGKNILSTFLIVFLSCSDTSSLESMIKGRIDRHTPSEMPQLICRTGFMLYELRVTFE